MIVPSTPNQPYPNPSFKDVEAFDFRRVDQLPNADIQECRVVQAAFAEGLATELSTYLRKEFSIALQEVRQMTWGTYARRLTSPACLIVLRAQTAPGLGALEIAPSFVFTVLEILLGGKSESAPDTARELTAIEKKLLAVFFRAAQRRLQQAWSNEGPDFVLDSVVGGADKVTGMSAEDPIVLAEFLVKADGVDGHMCLVVPARYVRQRRQNPDISAPVTTNTRQPGHTRRMLKQMHAGVLRVDTRLTKATLRIGDLAALQPGDVLDLGHPVSSPLSMCINGAEIYSGFIVPAGDKRAFSIHSTNPAFGVPAQS